MKINRVTWIIVTPFLFENWIFLPSCVRICVYTMPGLLNLFLLLLYVLYLIFFLFCVRIERLSQRSCMVSCSTRYAIFIERSFCEPSRM